MIVTHNLSMHFDRMETASAQIVRSDSGRCLSISLYENGEAWLVPADATISIHYLLPDGTGGKYTQMPDGSTACQCAYNVLTASLLPQVTTQCGVVNCTVEILKNGIQLRTFLIQLMVQPDTKIMQQSEDASITYYLPRPVQAAAAGQILEVAAVNENGIVMETIATDRLTELEQQVADLAYVPIAITNFSGSITLAEMGSTVNDITLRWTTNKAPTSLLLNDKIVAPGQAAIALTQQNITSDVVWTLKATDERNATASSSTRLFFYNGIYYGAGAQPESPDDLVKSLSGSRKRTFTVTAGEGDYIWYALPVRLGECTFKVGGFEGGFELLSTGDFTNAYNFTEEYRIYRSANAGLGTTTVEVY